VVIDDLDVLGARGGPTKADAELVIDADTVLSLAVAGQGFQPVSGWYAQIFKPVRNLQLPEFAAGDRLMLTNRPTRRPAASASVSRHRNDTIMAQKRNAARDG
jgi:hypothetical protein